MTPDDSPSERGREKGRVWEAEVVRVDDGRDGSGDGPEDEKTGGSDGTDGPGRAGRAVRTNRGGGRGGFWMIMAGWGLGVLVLALLFGGILERRENPNRLSVLAGQEGELVLLRDRTGHYRAEGWLNGVATIFLLDTGATRLAVSSELARRAGLERGATTRISTANGVVRAWRTRVPRLEIGPLVFQDLAAVIAPNLPNDAALLGMNALGDLHIEQRGEELILRLPES